MEIHEKFCQYTPEEIYAMSIDATVTLECMNLDGNQFSTGSGFLINSDGVILTAYHVIEGAYSINVRLSDGGVYVAQQVVGFDADRDIALIKISVGRELPFLKTETAGIIPGETVYALGSSLGFLNGSFSSGIVASNLREKIIDAETEEKMYRVQFTATISSGNSGGPLLNAKGNVIGIVSSSYVYGENLNLAIYIDEIKNIDQTYCRSIANFFADTQYYQIKMNERIVYEDEENSTVSEANNLLNGNTVMGISDSDDFDVYKVIISEYESVDFTLAFYDGYGEGIFYPLIYDSNLDLINEDADWKITSNDSNQTIYYSFGILTPGTYYIVVEGMSSKWSMYDLYVYWRPISELHEFEYPVYEDNFLR